VIAGAEADQPGHAHLIRIERLAAQRVHNRRAERVRELDNLVMDASYPAAAHDGHRFAVVEHRCKPVKVGLRWRDGRGRTTVPLRHDGRTLTQHDVARQHDHRRASLLDGRSHSTLQHTWELRRIGH